ncbi:hypothetical protein [Paenibacillus sp. YYML68]|uniref:YkvI family membrane protein n=1 Tax=Paenibacillus sp. YYML68 TaxID=2909250 RepID=UPI002491D2C7|nr:hypothetical protein [Paenibacillus sp. YYML68]
MKKLGSTLKVSFTYIGTVIGAGFATGQEILQFFTRYGSAAVITIGIATFFFTWIGIKLMLLASETNAKSYEDLNRLLFGAKIGDAVSLLTLISLFGVCTVMLAGGGSLFSEQLGLPYQLGLLFTMIAAYVVLIRGMDAIMAVNSVIVPMMAVFSISIVWYSAHTPGAMNWLTLDTAYSPLRVWFSPFLYAAFNLTMSQAVLVPLGVKIKDRSTIVWGGVIGGITIGLMLMALHYALSSQMPSILQYDIPMATILESIGTLLQWLFLLVIYGEIFTTLIADVYGLCLQLEQRIGVAYQVLLPIILVLSYAGSQFGFKTLISYLYPLFGMLSVAWLVLIVFHRSSAPPLNRAHHR